MKELIDRKTLEDILIQLKKDNISLYLAAFRLFTGPSSISR